MVVSDLLGVRSSLLHKLHVVVKMTSALFFFLSKSINEQEGKCIWGCDAVVRHCCQAPLALGSCMGIQSRT